MKIISWNVNGLRAILKKDFLALVQAWKADFVCLQETKINYDLPLGLTTYQQQWSHGQRPGYAGTMVLTRQTESWTRRTLPTPLAAEGRGVWLELPAYHLLNIYFPNGGQGAKRLAYKMTYYNAFLEFIRQLDQTKPIIFCGDVNTAHCEIDLARPKENRTHTGFLPEERTWLDQVVAAGFSDSWRTLHPQQIGYSWWDYKTRARARNVGWRIDYFWVSQRLQTKIKRCEILTEVSGSDHAPIELVIAN